MISATIKVYRDDEEIEVFLEGCTELIGSYDPRERGVHICTFSSYGPDVKSFELTKEEEEQAVQKLEEALHEK